LPDTSAIAVGGIFTKLINDGLLVLAETYGFGGGLAGGGGSEGDDGSGIDSGDDGPYMDGGIAPSSYSSSSKLGGRRGVRSTIASSSCF
jgi:hypothetical protein